MRYSLALSALLVAAMAIAPGVRADGASADTSIAPAATAAAEGLDLVAVGEVFKDSKTLEDFETALNDPKTGINNMDLDDNGKVDYLRVVDEAADDTHVVVIQAALGPDDFQDVATIEIERTDADNCNMQVHGAELIYGPNYYVAPAVVAVHAWPVIAWMYRPGYRPYRSAWYFAHYPVGWKPWRPVAVSVYRGRAVVFHRRAGFRVVHTTRVTTVTRVKYSPLVSTRVKRTRVVVRETPRGKVVKVKRRR